MSFSVGLLSEPSLATDDIHLESKLQSCLSSDMEEKTLTSDGFLTTTKEQELINETEDMQTYFYTKEDLNRLLSEKNNEFVEDIPSAQVPRQNTSSQALRTTNRTVQAENATEIRTSLPKPAPA